MKKIVFSAFLFLGVSLFAYDGWGNQKSFSENDNLYNQKDNYVQWVTRNTGNKRAIGLGFDEDDLGVVFTVNTGFGLFDTEESNLYSTINYTYNRVVFNQGYDILQNFGFKGFQLIPFIGVSADTSSADVGFLTGVNARYNISNSFSVNAGYKQYISKPVSSDSRDEEPDTKGYPSIYLELKF